MTRYEVSAKNIYIIGCGGVASWLLPALLKLLEGVADKPTIHLVDGDRLEEKNLDRQLFNPLDIGQFKSDALLNLYARSYPGGRMRSVTKYLDNSFEPEEHSLYFACADNHPARRLVLQLVDAKGGRAIIGGNEYTDAEAYMYEPAFAGTGLDPRKYYPDLLTSDEGDPTRPAGCQGEVAVATPQLVLSNYLAAGYMAHLFWFHYVERQKLAPDDRPYWPIKQASTFSRLSTTLVKDLAK